MIFKNCKLSNLLRLNFRFKRTGNNLKNKNGDNVGGNKTTNNAVVIFNLNSETELSGQIEQLMNNTLANYTPDLAQNYAQEIVDAVNKVPQAKKITPKLSTYSTITESLKYMDETEKRSLFANLIASAMNRDTSNSHQDAFVRIIEQLNKNDIQVLKHIINIGLQLRGVISITKYTEPESQSNRTFSYLESILFSRYSGEKREIPVSNEELRQDTMSLENFLRLGLFELNNLGFKLSDPLYYDVYETSTLYQNYKQQFGEKALNIRYNSVSPTKLCEEFVRICFNSNI